MPHSKLDIPLSSESRSIRFLGMAASFSHLNFSFASSALLSRISNLNPSGKLVAPTCSRPHEVELRSETRLPKAIGFKNLRPRLRRSWEKIPPVVFGEKRTGPPVKHGRPDSTRLVTVALMASVRMAMEDGHSLLNVWSL